MGFNYGEIAMAIGVIIVATLFLVSCLSPKPKKKARIAPSAKADLWLKQRTDVEGNRPVCLNEVGTVLARLEDDGTLYFCRHYVTPKDIEFIKAFLNEVF